MGVLGWNVKRRQLSVGKLNHSEGETSETREVKSYIRLPLTPSEGATNAPSSTSTCATSSTQAHWVFVIDLTTVGRRELPYSPRVASNSRGRSSPLRIEQALVSVRPLMNFASVSISVASRVVSNGWVLMKPKICDGVRHYIASHPLIEGFVV